MDLDRDLILLIVVTAAIVLAVAGEALWDARRRARGGVDGGGGRRQGWVLEPDPADARVVWLRPGAASGAPAGLVTAREMTECKRRDGTRG